MIKTNEPQERYQQVKPHRDGGPAIIYPDGTQQWYHDGMLHREGGPAVVCPDGRQEWYLHGQRHREGGPAIAYPDGYEAWYSRGLLHREDGPAIADDGVEMWYRYDQRFASEAEHQHAVALAHHDGYTLHRVAVPGQPVLYVAGCRRFSLSEARAHWCESGSNRAPFIRALASEA